MNEINFAKRLKHMRHSMKLTLAQFAEMGGVSTTTQGMYERTSSIARYPDIKYLFNLQRNGINISYLLFNKIDTPNTEEGVLDISGKPLEIALAYKGADDQHKLVFEALASIYTNSEKRRIRE